MINFKNETKIDSLNDYFNMVFKDKFFDSIRGLEKEIDIVFKKTYNQFSSTELSTNIINSRLFISIYLAPSVIELLTNTKRYNRTVVDLFILELVFHEMVHAKQFIDGRLRVDAIEGKITGVTFWDEHGKHTYSIDDLQKNNSDQYGGAKSIAKKMKFAHEQEAIEEAHMFIQRFPKPSTFQLHWNSFKLVMFVEINKRFKFEYIIDMDKTVICQNETEYNKMIKDYFH